MERLGIPILLLILLSVGFGFYLYTTKPPTVGPSTGVSGPKTPIATPAGSVSEAIKRANTLIDSGNFPDALALLEPFKTSDLRELQLCLGYACAGNKEFSNAILCFEKASAQRRDTQVLYSLAVLQENLGEMAKAKSLYDELTRVGQGTPVMAKASLGLARCADFLGDTTTAIEAYKKVIKENPSLAEPFIGLLKMMKRMGFSKGVDKIREKGLPLHGEKFEFQFWLGSLYFEVGEMGKAREAFERCIRLKPENSSPYYFLYKILRKNQKLEEAMGYLEKFYENNTFLPYIFFQAAIDAKTENQPALAFKFLRAAVLQDRSLLGRDDQGTIVAVERHIKTQGTSEEKIFLIPFMLFINSEFRLANERMKQVISELRSPALKIDAERVIRQTNPMVAGEDAYNGYLASIKGEQDQAMANLKNRLSMSKVGDPGGDPFDGAKRTALGNPKDAKLQYKTALELARGGDLDGAKLFLRESLRASPYISEAWYSLAKIAQVEGDTQQAIQSLDQAVKINPNNSQARSFLSQLLMDSGDLERASAEARGALLANPNNGEARMILANISIQNQKKDQALAEVEFGLQVEKDPTRIEQFNALKRQLSGSN